jgi:hypothetical protein
MDDFIQLKLNVQQQQFNIIIQHSTNKFNIQLTHSTFN